MSCRTKCTELAIDTGQTVAKIQLYFQFKDIIRGIRHTDNNQPQIQTQKNRAADAAPLKHIKTLLL